MTTLLTTAEAARALGVSHSHVRWLIRKERLVAVKRDTPRGPVWYIRPCDLAAARARPGRGRPRQAKEGETQ